MTKFKKGDKVWVFRADKATGYPAMNYRPAIVTKKIHPLSYKVSSVATDYNLLGQIPSDRWKFDRKKYEHERHPSDLLRYSDAMPWEDNKAAAKEHLEKLCDQWKHTASPEAQDAWWKSEEDRKQANIRINQRLRPILARMFS